MKEKLRVMVVLLGLVVMLGVSARQSFMKRQNLVYADSLEETALIVDDVELTLRDVAVYIAYQEKTIQKDAVIYNPQNPVKYWNTYTNRNFMRSLAENAVKDMAVHDEIFYQLAMTEGLTLSQQEEAYLANEIQDFFMDLSEEQFARLGVTKEDMEAAMRKIALANKYQSILAQADGLYYEDYNYTGVMYELIVKEHEVKVQDSVWDRISVGSITVNY